MTALSLLVTLLPVRTWAESAQGESRFTNALHVPPSQPTSTSIAPAESVEVIEEPPKRLELAITGTALAGHGLLVLGIFLLSNEELKRNQPMEGAVIPAHAIFLPIGGIMMATGSVMALIGWTRYVHWKRWSRTKHIAFPGQRRNQITTNPMIQIRHPRPKWSTGPRMPRPRQVIGLGWLGRF